MAFKLNHLPKPRSQQTAKFYVDNLGAKIVAESALVAIAWTYMDSPSTSTHVEDQTRQQLCGMGTSRSTPMTWMHRGQAQSEWSQVLEQMTSGNGRRICSSGDRMGCKPRSLRRRSRNRRGLALDDLCTADRVLTVEGCMAAKIRHMPRRPGPDKIATFSGSSRLATGRVANSDPPAILDRWLHQPRHPQIQNDYAAYTEGAPRCEACTAAPGGQHGETGSAWRPGPRFNRWATGTGRGWWMSR
jgi:hypothetical protein